MHLPPVAARPGGGGGKGLRAPSAHMRRFLAFALVTRSDAQRDLPPSLAHPVANIEPVPPPADGLPIQSGRGLQDSSDFSCINIASTISMDHKFAGGVAVGDVVVFVPFRASCIGVFNPTSNTFSCHSISVATQYPYNRFYYATASNGLAIFAPWYANCVGVFNPSTNSFSCVDISGTISGISKFSGAATTASGLVVFAPHAAGCVGTFNPVTNVFNCIDVAFDGNFVGASTASNGLVIFIPRAADCVGVFDPATNAFSCVDITATTSLYPAPHDGAKFHGGTTASNGLIIFAPHGMDCIGVFDPATNGFSCVNITDTSASHLTATNLEIDGRVVRFRWRKFDGATTARNGLVVFAPDWADCVGLFDPTTNAFSCIDIFGSSYVAGSYFGAVTASNGIVVLVPKISDCVGTLVIPDPPSPPAAPQTQDGAVIEMTGDDPKLIFGTLEDPTCQLSIDRLNSRLVSTCSIQDSRRLEETFDCEAKYAALEQKYEALQSEVSELRQSIDALVKMAKRE